MFKGEKGAALVAELGQKSKTFTPGAPVNGVAKPSPTPQAKQDMEAIKVCDTITLHSLTFGLE